MFLQTRRLRRTGDDRIPYRSFFQPCHAIGRFFFVLALTGRSVINIGFVERPLVLGLAWHLCLGGDFLFIMGLAVFFELFWLDLFPFGNKVSPMPAFPFLILVSAYTQFGVPAGLGDMVLPVLASLPLAYIMPGLEQKLRLSKEGGYMRILEASGSEESLLPLYGAVMGRSVMIQIILGLGCFLPFLFFATFLFYSGLITPFLPQLELPAKGGLNWMTLFASIAAIGAILSLRIKRSFIIFFFCLAVVALTRSV